MTLLICSVGVVVCVVALVLGVVRAALPCPPQQGRCNAQAPDLDGPPQQQPGPDLWPLLSPARARWRRWWRCSERRRAEKGRGLPLLVSESCWEPPAKLAFHEEDVSAMVRFYVMVHMAEEGQPP